MCVCVCVWSLCCVWFFANPMDHSPPGPSVHGISQARILEWAAISYSRASSWLRDQTTSLVSPAPAGRIFATAPHVINEWHSWAWNQASQYGHSVNIYWVTVRFCMVPSAEIQWWTKIFTVINLVKFSFLVHGISQARILEWVTTPFSQGSPWPRDQTQVPSIGRQIHWASWET